MKLNNIKIGVLGGIGPEATIYFYEKLIQQIKLNFHPKTNCNFPQIIINSIPAPEIIYSKKISAKEISVYKDGIKELNKHKPDFIIIVCNTIHLFHEEIQKISKAKIINIQEAIIEKINNTAHKDICILGTPNTMQKKLYYTNNKKYYSLNKKNTSLISSLIERYNIGIKNKEESIIFNKLLKKVMNNCKFIILGCTELCLLNKTHNKNIISSLDVMVEETIKTIKLTKKID